ncbi:MAG: hypothetical protein ACQESF_00425 [Nanobdellota archaeon]
MVNLHEMCKAKREYLSPELIDYKNYCDHLEAFNEAILDDATEWFSDSFSDSEDMTLCTTGSDARLEKGPRSDLELMVLLPESGDDKNSIDALNYLMKNCEGLEFDEDLEFKYIEKGDLSRTTLNSSDGSSVQLVSPDRMIDCCYMTGSHYLYNRSRKKFVKELKDNEYGKNILKKIKDRVRNHRKITRTGAQKYKGSTVKHFDLDTGDVFYHPQNSIYSFKQGPLRAIQTSLVRDFVKGIKSDKIDDKYCFTCKSGSRRQGIVPKLNYLRVRDMLSVSDKNFNDITDCYKYFLWGYHVSESCYHDKGQKQTQFDKNEMRDRLDFVDNFCSGTILSYLD